MVRFMRLGEKEEKTMVVDEINHKSPSQAVLIRRHLEMGKEINPIEAFNIYGVNRLAARIHELIHDKGMNIQKREERRNGKKYTFYFLEKDAA